MRLEPGTRPGSLEIVAHVAPTAAATSDFFMMFSLLHFLRFRRRALQSGCALGR